MRVLLLTQVVPFPPDAGPKVKTYNVLRMLARRHEVELLTFVRDEREREAAQALGDLCSRMTMVPLERKQSRESLHALRGWARGTPFLVARDFRREMADAVRSRLDAGGIDVVHADQLSMAQYLPGRFDPVSARTVFDAHNAVWQLVRSLAGSQPTIAHRAAARLEWRLLRRFEGSICRDADLTFAVSDVDAGALRQAAGGPVRVEVVPIGVEVRDALYSPPDPNARRLLSVATMHYPPNADALRWFRDDVWPFLTTEERSVGFDIVGNRPPDDLREWSAGDPDVRVHGYVDDLEPLYRSAGIFVVPLRAGSGVRVKILEALARGIPVVSTSIGIEGLDLRPGEHLMVADDAATFAQAIRWLLEAPERRADMAAAARTQVNAYDWRVCLQPLLDAYERLEPVGEQGSCGTAVIRSATR